jgi:hypothetical protein
MPNSSARIGSSFTRGEAACQVLRARPIDSFSLARSLARIDVLESESSRSCKESPCARTLRSEGCKLIYLPSLDWSMDRVLLDDTYADVQFGRWPGADDADDSD